jgi:hypothetical protein
VDLHLLVIGPGGRVYHRARTDELWHGWTDLGPAWRLAVSETPTA